MANLTNVEKFLYELLDCDSPAELRLLDNVKFPWKDVARQMCVWTCEEIDINLVMMGVVDLGTAEMKRTINQRVEKLKLTAPDKANDAVKAELVALQDFTPKKDIEICCGKNGVVSHVGFADNENVYRQYLPDAIAVFENNVGLKF